MDRERLVEDAFIQQWRDNGRSRLQRAAALSLLSFVNLQRHRNQRRLPTAKFPEIHETRRKAEWTCLAVMREHPSSSGHIG
ncbi:unnamed protein product [Lampetra planeri]